MHGHGGTDVGASYGGRYEKDDTLHVAKLVKEKDEYAKAIAEGIIGNINE